MQFDTLVDVHKYNKRCNLCELSKLCSNVIVGRGDERAKYMFVLEQPSGFDDVQDEIISGRESRFFDKILKSCNLRHEDVYLTYAVKCFSFKRDGKKRKEVPAHKHHIEACKRWIWEEIKLVEPEIIFVLGTIPSRSLINAIRQETRCRMSDLLGNKIRVPYTSATIIPLYSLSYMMYVSEWHTKKCIYIIKKAIEEIKRSKSEDIL